MNRNKRTKKDLAISVMIAVVGFAVLWLSQKIIDCRIFGGGYGIPTSEFIIGLKTIIIMALEWGTSLLGITMLGLGSIGIYNNAKKLMR